LREFLATQVRVKAPAVQWLGTIRNLTSKGLRNEELQRSGLIRFLEARSGDTSRLTGDEVAQAVDMSALRISVIANIDEARTQLRFQAESNRPVARIKGEPKPQQGQGRRLCMFDRVLGYRIEEVEHAA